MSSTSRNPFLMRAVLTLGKRKNCWCVIRRIGWLACLYSTMFGQKCFIATSAEWKWALSCNKNKLSSARNCSFTGDMRFNDLQITSTQKALLTICLSDTNSVRITPCLSKIITMVLILVFCKRNILGFDDDFEVHCMFWHFISGSYWNTHNSSPVRVQSRKLGLSWQVWMQSWHDASLRCFHSSLSLCETNFA